MFATVLMLGLVAASQEARPTALEWNAEAVQHLLDRAAFGGTPAEIARALEKTPEEFVDELLHGFAPEGEAFPNEPIPRPSRSQFENEDEYFHACLLKRRAHRRQLADFSVWWIQQMLESHDPLREKMVLFWHGHFCSAGSAVKSSYGMIVQNELFRKEALGNFGTLLHAVVHDPAMIVYLDNDVNTVENPNENLGREIMELFSLGIGNYTEKDIKEAARALTGWKVDDIASEAKLYPRLHDKETKTILGHSGRFDADGLVEVLLDQESCPRFIAAKLLSFFEGVQPGPERQAEYAAALKTGGYELAPFLRKLFLDPRFYRQEIRGERVAGPVEFLVGSARRLEIQVPPAVIFLGAAQLGQRLFEPPNVKGWEQGDAWIRTSTLLARGNLAGVLVGLVRPNALLEDEVQEGESPIDPASIADWTPALDLVTRLAHQGAKTDARIVEVLGDELLPIPMSAAGHEALLAFLSAERADLKLEDGALLDAKERAEAVLRRLVHLILSLPEAQMS